MQVHAGAIFERLGGRQKGKRNIGSLSRSEGIGRRQHHPARQILDRDPGEIQRRALTGKGLFGGLAVYLHAAHAHPLAAWKNFQLIFPADRTRNQRARDHRPEALHREHAIDGQPRERIRVFGGNLGSNFGQRLLQLGEARAGERAYHDDRRMGGIEEGSSQEFFDFQADNVERFGIDSIRLR